MKLLQVWKKIRVTILVVLVGVVLTAAFTWPFVTKLKTFYYDRGDYPISGSILAYNEHSILTGNILDRKNYINGNLYYPQPYSLVYYDTRLVPSLIYIPIHALTNNLIFSINSVAFLTFVLSFISAFYAINYFINNKLASIIGGVVYAFNPLTISRFPEHFDLMNKYFIPLVFLSAYMFLKQPNFRNSFFFFSMFTLNAFSAIYFQIFSIIILPIFALPFIFMGLVNKNKVYFANLFKHSLIFLVFLPLLIYYDSPYLEFSGKEGSLRSLEMNANLSARIIDYISPVKNSYVYGGLADSLDKFREPKNAEGTLNYLEHTLFLNITPMLFAIVAFIIIVRNGLLGSAKFFFPFALLFVISFVFTFGPFFQGWNSKESDIKLPYYYLYQMFPLLKGIRAPIRFQFIFYVPFSMLVSLGVLYTLSRFKPNYLKISVFLFLLGALFLENLNPSGPVVSFAEESSVIPKVNRINGDTGKLSFLAGKNTFHFPLYSPDLKTSYDSVYLNWAAITREKTVNGNPASFVPLEQLTFLSGLANKVSEENLKDLTAIGVDYVIIHTGLLTSPQSGGQYSKFQEETVLNEDGIIILDMNKFSFNIPKCDFNKDLKIDYKAVIHPQLLQTLYIVTIKNNSDCYLPSIYNEKYKTIDYSGTNLYGEKSNQKLYLKLPVLVKPYEEIILSDINNNLRVE